MTTLDDVMVCLSPLVGVGHGWDDETVMAYADVMIEWPNADALCEACHDLALSWTKATRVPLGVIYDRYRQVLQARALRAPQMPELPIKGAVTAKQGREIAARAYAQECAKQGREPDTDTFNMLVGAIGVAT